MITHIRDSRALSSDTLKETRSKILEEGGCIFLKKESSGDTRYLIEKNADFYKKVGTVYRKQRKMFNKIMVDITAKCNLKCPVCYRRPHLFPDLDMRTLIRLSNEWRGKIISLCGGEPTVREDLPEIIKMFSRKNTVFLISNGIRLADLAYLKYLKKAGLQHVSFSLNALSEEALSKINGEGLLARKLQALDNLGRVRMRVVLAMVLVRGINEKELKGMLEFYLKNRNFIRELRIRAMAPLGSYLDREKLCLSEMVNIVTRELQINVGDLLKEFQLKGIVNELFEKEIFTMKSCSFDFHLRIKNQLVAPIAANLDLKTPDRQLLFFKTIRTLVALLKMYGITMVWRGCWKLVFRKQAPPWLHSKDILKVGLRVWPDINTIDMEENERCGTGYWMDGEILSFCHANIIKDNKAAQSQ